MLAFTTAFLDRDGVINRKAAEDDYIKSWEEFAFLPGVADALRVLADAGVRLVVVTNQRGVARGRMPESAVQEIHRRMVAELESKGAKLDAIFYCPHDEGQCDCRKPSPGLFLRALREHPSIDLTRSAVIGDSLCDLRAAHNLGIQAFLIAGGARKDAVLSQARLAGIAVAGCAPSLLELVQHIHSDGMRA